MLRSVLESTDDLFHSLKSESFSLVGSWDVDLVRSQVFWSPETKKIHDVPPDYVCSLEEAFSFFKDPKDMELLLFKFNEATQSNSRYDVKVKLTSFTGIEKWVRTIGIPVFEEGNCVRIYGVIQDITESVQLETIKTKQKDFFEHTFHEALIGMGIVNPNGQFVMVNKSLCKMLGYHKNELIELTFKDITHPDDLELSKASFEDFKSGKIKKYSVEKRYLKKNGTVLYAILSTSVICGDDGKLLFFIVQITDITARHKAEDKVQNLLNVTTDQNKRLLNFAHIVSHNLRSHSGNIGMLLDLVNYEHPDIQNSEMMLYLKKAVGELTETISHLNEVVLMHTNSKKNVVRLNLRENVEKTLSVLSGILLEAKSNVTNTINDSITIDYIPAYLESILLNLISNAIKYRSPERISEIRIYSQTETGYFVLCIEDNGLGIDLETYGDKLFGMYKTFHQHEDSRGIGLFLTKNQIEAMNGKITVESTPNQGTTFKIYFKHETN